MHTNNNIKCMYYAGIIYAVEVLFVDPYSQVAIYQSIIVSLIVCRTHVFWSHKTHNIRTVLMEVDRNFH